MDIAPLVQGNLSVRAYLALREALIAGTFGPGERIVMQDLALRLGTSVTPVREACLRLISEQALEVRSGRFVTVPEMTLSRYIEIRTIRLALEGLAAELAAAHVQPADVDHLVRVQSRFRAAQDAGDAPTMLGTSREFHFTIYRLSQMEMLVREIESMWVSMGPILKIYHEDILTDRAPEDEHARLIEALRLRDGPQARAVLEQDLRRAGEGIIRYLKAHQSEAPADNGLASSAASGISPQVPAL